MRESIFITKNWTKSICVMHETLKKRNVWNIVYEQKDTVGEE